MAFSPDGNTLAAGSIGQLIRLWRAKRDLEPSVPADLARDDEHARFITGKVEALLLSSFEGIKQLDYHAPPGAMAPLIDGTKRLVRFYESTGRLEQAGEWRKREVLTAAIADAATRSASGWDNAQHGRFAEAAADFARLIELRPGEHEVWHWQAVILVQRGQLQAYRELRHKSVERFGNTTNPYTAERIARDLLILPCSGADLETAAKMAETAVSAPTNHPAMTWFRFAKGLAEYRQGHFASAAEWSQKVVSDAGHELSRDAGACMLLAMAQHQLKQSDEARGTLAKGLKILDTKMHRLESSGFADDWIEWIIAHALLAEAKALIDGQPAMAEVEPAPLTLPRSSNCVPATSTPGTGKRRRWWAQANWMFTASCAAKAWNCSETRPSPTLQITSPRPT